VRPRKGLRNPKPTAGLSPGAGERRFPGLSAKNPRFAPVQPALVSRTFGGVSATLAALLLLEIAPAIPRRRALPAPPIRPRLWQRTSGPGH
jgi:hypothetical protein